MGGCLLTGQNPQPRTMNGVGRADWVSQLFVGNRTASRRTENRIKVGWMVRMTVMMVTEGGGDETRTIGPSRGEQRLLGPVVSRRPPPNSRTNDRATNGASCRRDEEAGSGWIESIEQTRRKALARGRQGSNRREGSLLRNVASVCVSEYVVCGRG